jgi:hypothetical protein
MAAFLTSGVLGLSIANEIEQIAFCMKAPESVDLARAPERMRAALCVCLSASLLSENAVGDAVKAWEDEGEAVLGLAAMNEAATDFLAWTRFAHFFAVACGLVHNVCLHVTRA